MYVPAEQKTNTDRTNIKNKVGTNQLETFVDGRESTAIQRALIDSIHQSAPRPGAGVVQRNKGDILDAHPELIGVPAQGFIRRLYTVAGNGRVRAAVQGLLAAQQNVRRARQAVAAAQQNLRKTQQAVAAAQQVVDVALQPTLSSVGLGFLYRGRDTLAAIGEFINTWNQDGETDLIDVADFFYFKTLLGEATPTEGTLAQIDPLPTMDEMDEAVAIIGHDDSRDDLNTGIIDFISGRQEEEAVVPQFLTFDLVSKHRTWSPQGNKAFIDNLTSPYIKICHPEICMELASNGGGKLGHVEKMGTRFEVNCLLDRGYEFVEPCLLLSPVLHVTGVDVRRLQRMRVQPEKMTSIVERYGAQESTVPPGFNFRFVRQRPIPLKVVGYGPLVKLELDKSLELPLSLDLQIGMTGFEDYIAILQPGVLEFNFHCKKLRAVVPQQLLWPLEDDIIMSGMSTAKCMVAVQPLETNSLLISQSTDWPKSLHVCVCIENPEPEVTIWDWKGFPPQASQSPVATPSRSGSQSPTGRRGRAPRANEDLPSSK